MPRARLYSRNKPSIHPTQTRSPSMSTPTYLPALGRLLIALIFVLSGLSKIAAPANTIAYIQSAGAPFAPAAFGIAAIVEVIGGLALLVGFHTRLVAAILATSMLSASVRFHNNLAHPHQMNDIM